MEDASATTSGETRAEADTGSSSRVRKLLLATATVPLALVVLEVVLALVEPLYLIRLKNPFDRHGRTALVRRDTEIAESVLHGMLSHELTYSDAEILFRVRPNPGGQAVLGYEGVNSLGFRGAEFAFVAVDGAGRDSGPQAVRDGNHAPADHAQAAGTVMCLGDSCTFGLGIYDHTKTFPHLLGERLDGTGEPWRVYNLGQPGHSTYQGLLLLRKWLDRMRPDVLVLYFGWNDMWPSPRLTDSQTIAALTAPAALPVPALVRDSHLYTAMSFVVDKFRSGRSQRGDPSQGQTIRVPLEEGLHYYDEMLSRAEAAGTRTLFIIPPYSRKELAGLQSRFTEFYRKHLAGRVTFVELERMQITGPDCQKYIQQDGLHPNEKGAAHIAEELCTLITHPATDVAVAAEWCSVLKGESRAVDRR